MPFAGFSIFGNNMAELGILLKLADTKKNDFFG